MGHQRLQNRRLVSLKLVLDTSILIDHLRGGDKWKRILSELEEDTEIYISSIVLFELYSGKSSQNPQISSKIQQLVKNFQKIEIDAYLAQKAGELYRDMKQTIQIPDYIIAASALEIGAQVATLNNKDFEQIPGLKLYSVT